MRIVLLGFAMLFLAGCSALGVLNSPIMGAGVPVAQDVAYAPGDRHSLDVYAPKAASHAPVVVFFYGGGWDSGKKEDYRFVGGSFADRGYVTIVPDYRIYPQARYPDFLQDGAMAVAWAKKHAAEYGGDPDRIVLIGHSAGAYIAVMLSLDKEWLAAVGLDPRRDIAATVGLAGPYDFLPLHTATLKTIFGPPDQLPRTQPITYANGHAPPMLLAIAKKDDSVNPGNSIRLAARLRAKGSSVELITYPNLSHPTLIGAVAWPLRFLAPVLANVARFVDAHSRVEPLPVSG